MISLTISISVFHTTNAALASISIRELSRQTYEIREEFEEDFEMAVGEIFNQECILVMRIILVLLVRILVP